MICSILIILNNETQNRHGICTFFRFLIYLQITFRNDVLGKL
jgi:hypothetical protein